MVDANLIPSDVPMLTIYVSDIKCWPECDPIVAAIFGACKPARAIVPTRDLHFGYLIEASAIYVAGEAGPTRPELNEGL